MIPAPSRGLLRTAVALACAAALAAAATTSAQASLGVETFDAAWRIIRDSHFDRTFNGHDWDRVAAELRPRAAAAATASELRAVLRNMLARLGQSHFSIIPAAADGADAESADLSGSPGFDVRLAGADLLVTEVEPGSAAAESGVRPGWKLLAVGGTSVQTLLEPLPDSIGPRLLAVEAWRLANTRLRGASGTTAAVTFENGAGAAVRLDLGRRGESGQPVTVGNLPTMFVRVEDEPARTPAGRLAGVIRFNVWMAAVDAPFQRAVDRFREAEGIVVDLRGNPGGLAAMLMGISGHFIAERRALGVMKTREGELRFNVNPRRVSAAGERVEPYAGPVAILIDGLSGSASECFAGGMQSLGRARIFGQTSMGQALPALFARLPNGDVLIHAYGDFVTSDGTRLEGRGVVPDEPVAIDRAALLAGRDPVLEAALGWIDGAAAARGQGP